MVACFEKNFVKEFIWMGICCSVCQRGIVNLK